MGRKSYVSFGEMLDATRGFMGSGAENPDTGKHGHPEKADDWTFGSALNPSKTKNWLWNDENGAIKAEMGSCSNTASARGMAKLAAMVANGGIWDGVEYISP